MDIHAYIGIIAGILSLLPCPFYVYGIIKGKTRPDRITWWILALMSCSIAITYYEVGARTTIWLPIAYTISFLINAILSIRYGDGPAQLHMLDRICLLGAVVSLGMWYFLNAPFLA